MAARQTACRCVSRRNGFAARRQGDLTWRPTGSIYCLSRVTSTCPAGEENEMKPFRTLLVGALAVLLTTTSAWAQLSTAQLSGRITDESGAVLPGVTVT